MKLNDDHFEDYLTRFDEYSLHPKLTVTYNALPSSPNNLILYGPSGIGKYTQSLAIIRRYSPSKLKYEKKISIPFNKNIYFYKISDIHFEIDMSLLGCNSKLLWNEIYTHIIDIILAKTENVGIILCKNFHETHSELLDIFYSYMQTLPNNRIKLTFILITEKLSFIPGNIINISETIHYPRPTKIQYNKCLTNKLKKQDNVSDINNIKNIESGMEKELINTHHPISDKILDQMLNPTDACYIDMRDKIYDIFIYNLDVTECIWYILTYLISNNHIEESAVNDVMIECFSFFQYYNNNYRPIYHLEKFIFYLINRINGFQLCS
jgi:hypothetical protein|tara:strand:+ start:4722 stop:5690 length:969 start_codon:yes stop_codon:yes gene_type:complete